MKIVQIHTSDSGGGAEIIAAELHRDFMDAGHACQLWVGRKETELPNVYCVDRRQRVAGELRVRRWCEAHLGLQNFCSPGSLELHKAMGKPDVLVIHSMHGSQGYFNIEALPALARCQPTFLVLHDQWTMTGHCSYSLGCDRWQFGCGRCPDLNLPPRIARDGTRLNWLRKRWAYRRSAFTVVPTATWVGDYARESPLFCGQRVEETIHNSADLTVFKPGDRAAARSELGLPESGQIVLFLANLGIRAPFKDFATLATAFSLLKSQAPDCHLLAVGGEPDESTRRALPEGVVFRPPEKRREHVARFYQAADVFCHAAKADVCPLTVIEAQACGVPVVASRVGGIPEIIVDGKTGVLVPPSDPQALCAAMVRLLKDDELRVTMAQQARASAVRCFSPERRREAYLRLFRYAVREGGA